MSRAEIQAHTLYETMHLATVDEEVKKQLIILMLSNPTVKKQSAQPYTTEELLLHLKESADAIAKGDVVSMVEADAEMENFVNTL